LLHPLSHFVLQAEISRSLDWTQKLCKLALLALGEIKSLPLEPHRLIEQLANASLIRAVAGHQLLPQLASYLTFTREEREALLFKPAIACLKLRHLVVGKLQPATHHILHALIKSLFQQLPPGPRRPPGRNLRTA